MPAIQLDPDTQRVLLQNLNVQYKAELNQAYMFGAGTLAALAAGRFFNKWLALASLPLGWMAWQKWQAADKIRVDRDRVNMTLVLL